MHEKTEQQFLKNEGHIRFIFTFFSLGEDYLAYKEDIYYIIYVKRRKQISFFLTNDYLNVSIYRFLLFT